LILGAVPELERREAASIWYGGQGAAEGLEWPAAPVGGWMRREWSEKGDLIVE
jgi:hypothetical protein